MSIIKSFIKDHILSDLFSSQKINPKNYHSDSFSKYLLQDHLKQKVDQVIDKLKDKTDVDTIFINFENQFIQEVKNCYQVFTEIPPITTLKNVIYFPNYLGLYTQEGDLLDISCLRRSIPFESKETIIDSKVKVSIPNSLDTINTPMVYVGYPFYKHYGHFLLEAISRLWYLFINQQYPILCHDFYLKSREHKYIDSILSSLNLDKNCFISFKKPVLLQEVIIPHSSFKICNQGFTIHKLIPELFASLNLEKESLKVNRQPVYLSRAKLHNDKRKIEGEQYLSQRLQEKGFKVVYPETLSLKEQINLFNQQELILGCLGSGLHNILFSLTKNTNIICFSGDKVHPNYLIIDEIKSRNSVYINALSPSSVKKNGSVSQQNQILNVGLVLDTLKNLDLI